MDLSFLSAQDHAAVTPLLKNRLEAFKIGATLNSSTSSPEKRMKALQTGNPFLLKLVDEIPCKDPLLLEKYFHEIYKQKRVHNEWFSLSKHDVFQICREGHSFHRYGTLKNEALFQAIMERNDLR